MCGIAGYYSPRRSFEDTGTLAAMLRSIAHRGPDDAGLLALRPESGEHRQWGAIEPQPFAHGLGLAHCRFAIVDPSDAGRQPMWNESRDAVLVCNGEIYDHVEQRERLEKLGHRFHSACDTEVVLAAYDEWGLDAFSRLRGFYALALWDLRRRRLVLARDPAGKSPLYWTVRAGVLWFASEIKALREACGADAFPVRDQAVCEFVHQGWRDLDHETFYAGVRSLEAASFAVVGADLGVRPVRHWSLPERRLGARELPVDVAVPEFRELLDEALRLRERADVGVAMELSGGLDSSALVALRAARGEGERFPVYTVKFDEPEADEEHFARQLAERHPERIDYRVIRPPRLEFWDHADSFVPLVEEPFHSPNLLTNHLVRRRIRDDGFRVVIAGSGGDELLAGYPHEVRMPYLLQLAEQRAFRPLLRELRAGGPEVRRALLRSLATQGDAVLGPRMPAQQALVEIPFRRESGPPRLFDARMRENWTRWKLPHWLRSGNKAVYGIPIEPRLPFMDVRLVEYAFRLPASTLVSRGWTKYLLRRVIEDSVPHAITWRRAKQGYPFPIAAFLRDSRERVLRNAAGCDLPGLRLDRLPEHYDSLVASDPRWLWRLVSVVLWHRRCHMGVEIT